MKPDMTFKMKWARDQGILAGHTKGYKEGYKDGYSKGINFTVKNYSSVILLCLKDKFNFNNDELQKIAIYINDTFDSVCKGYLTLNDISQVIKEENGLEVSFDGNIVNEAENLSNLSDLDRHILREVIKPSFDSEEDLEVQLKEGGYFG